METMQIAETANTFKGPLTKNVIEGYVKMAIEGKYTDIPEEYDDMLLDKKAFRLGKNERKSIMEYLTEEVRKDEFGDICIYEEEGMFHGFENLCFDEDDELIWETGFTENYWTDDYKMDELTDAQIYRIWCLVRMNSKREKTEKKIMEFLFDKIKGDVTLSEKLYGEPESDMPCGRILLYANKAHDPSVTVSVKPIRFDVDELSEEDENDEFTEYAKSAFDLECRNGNDEYSICSHDLSEKALSDILKRLEFLSEGHSPDRKWPKALSAIRKETETKGCNVTKTRGLHDAVSKYGTYSNRDAGDRYTLTLYHDNENKLDVSLVEFQTENGGILFVYAGEKSRQSHPLKKDRNERMLVSNVPPRLFSLITERTGKIISKEISETDPWPEFDFEAYYKLSHSL